MFVRSLTLIVVAGVCLAASPAPPPLRPPSETVRGPEILIPDASSGTLTDRDFARRAETDPIALLEAAIRRYRAEVRCYTAELHKHERVGGQLHEPEVIQLVVRDTPYAVRMIWENGAREVFFAKIRGVLYVTGENDGQIKVWRPDSLLKFVNSGTADAIARKSSRYSITEAGLASALERTYEAWSESRNTGTLDWKYIDTRPVEEVGGRECHIIQRTCSKPELDPFLMNEPRPDANSRPSEAFSTVTLMFDTKTWLQVGSRLERADGELIGSYYFRDIKLNPDLPADTFTPDAFSLVSQ